MNNKTFTVIAVLVIACLGCAVQYTHQEIHHVKVYSVYTQQKTHGDKDGFNTSYKYLVGTSRGTFQISPDGLYASKSFGSIQTDSTYRILTRGYSIPFIGMYPYIIKAWKDNKTNK